MDSGRTAGWLRIGVGAAVLALVASGCALARVSVSSTGTEGNHATSFPWSVTDDGRYVLFDSAADNLVPGDTNGIPDLFRHDTKTGGTVRVNVSATGAQLATGSGEAGMTPDGRYVVFTTNDAIDPADTNQSTDAYVRDLVANTTSWASQPPPGGFGDAYVLRAQEISDDGRYVSFIVHQTPVNSPAQLYRRDRQAGTTVALTDWLRFNDYVASGDARHFVLSPTCTVFEPECPQTPIVIDTDGSAAGWPAFQFTPCDFDDVRVISPDGRYLSWYSSHDSPGPQGCLLHGNYLVDRATGVASPAGLAGNIGAFVVGVSRGARAILYLAPGNVLPGGDGDQSDLYLRDRVRNTNSRQDFSVSAQLPDDDVFPAVLSDDGTQVAFATAATNLVPDDHNGVDDVFVRETGMPPSP